MRTELRLRVALEDIRAIFHSVKFVESTESDTLFKKLYDINEIVKAALVEDVSLTSQPMFSNRYLLALGDFAGMNEQAISTNIIREYSGNQDYGDGAYVFPETIEKDLENHEILIAYQSTGVYGCDSTSWILLRNRSTGEYYENHASHCSCYGWSGQWHPEKSPEAYLLSDGFSFYTGGYDEDAAANRAAVKEYIAKYV